MSLKIVGLITQYAILNTPGKSGRLYCIQKTCSLFHDRDSKIDGDDSARILCDDIHVACLGFLLGAMNFLLRRFLGGHFSPGILNSVMHAASISHFRQTINLGVSIVKKAASLLHAIKSSGCIEYCVLSNKAYYL